MVFETVVCGVDGSDEGLVAVRQAAALARESLTLVMAVDPWDELLFGPPGSRPGPRPLERAEETLAAAAREADGCAGEVRTRLVEGRPDRALLREATATGAGLVVVGSHGRGRMASAILGSVATTMINDARCSVLVARPTRGADSRIGTAVVGLDGSAASVPALRVATELRDAHGTAVRVIAAEQGAALDRVARLAEGHELTTVGGDAVRALIDAAADADLVIVGSRGLGGIRALGSVSARVAHGAPCSVLVARQRAEEDTDAGEPAERSRRIADIMTAPVVTAREDATLEEVTRLMLDNRIGAIPIVDADGLLRGIVTESTFAGWEFEFWRTDPEVRHTSLLADWERNTDLESMYRRARNLRARDVMTEPVAVAMPDESMQSVVERMMDTDRTHLPVVRDGVPVGMMARHDILKVAARIWAEPDDAQPRD